MKGNDELDNAKDYSPLALAFLGDAVYELKIRDMIVKSGIRKVNDLHNAVVEKVRASFQSRAILAIGDKLTEEENLIYHRGRNSGGVKAPKNADVVEYRRATGLEALFGYLYIEGRFERIDELISEILSLDEK